MIFLSNESQETRLKYPLTTYSDYLDNISFTIPGEAIAQGRPRATTVNGHARIYQPKKSMDYQNLVKMAAAAAMKGRKPFAGQIKVRITIYKPVPGSYPGYVRNAILLNGEMAQPTTKPDLDNVAKSILDGMTGIIYRDDAQVCELQISKHFGPAKTEVNVRYNATLNPQEEAEKE